MIRSSAHLHVVGTSRDDIEHKIRERVAKYLLVEVEEVDDLVDIDVTVSIGEAAPLELTFAAQCAVRLKVK
jgi:hypothetical protein